MSVSFSRLGKFLVIISLDSFYCSLFLSSLRHLYYVYQSVQLLSHVWLCDHMAAVMPGFPVHHQLPELAQIHVHQVSDNIQPSHPLSTPSPPAFSHSQHQGLFKWVSSSHQVAKDWSFSFSISPSNEYSGLISFRMDWLNRMKLPMLSF